MKVRAATDADVPAIAAIVLAAASAEAPWTSYLPASARRDPVLVRHVETVVRGHLAAGETTSVVVVGELSAAESDRNAPEIVSLAVWDTTQIAGAQTDAVSHVTDDDWTPRDGATGPDHAKLASLGDAMRRGRERYFAAAPPHLYLRLLATHPDHRGRGHAKALCRWGMALARRRRVGVCLETGARGYILLSGMGFRDLGAVDLPPAGKGREKEEAQVLKALRMDAAAVRAARPGAWDSVWRYIWG